MKSYRIIWIIVLVIIFVVSLVFSQVYIYDYAHKENMGNIKPDLEEENRLCQTTYMQNIQSILTSPSVDPAEGYLTNKDVLKKINAVENSCKWNNRTKIEKKFENFKKLLSSTDNPNQLNKLLVAIQ